MQEISCLRAKLWFLADSNELAPVYIELLALLSSSLSTQKNTKKQNAGKVGVGGLRVGGGFGGNRGELNKQGSYRFRGTAKNLWRHVWTGATANSLAS